MREVCKKAAEFCRPFEGLSLKAYWDPVGFPTQGVGHLLDRTVTAQAVLRSGVPSSDITGWLRRKYPDIAIEKAEEWLLQDIEKAHLGALHYTTAVLNISQMAAVTDFCFNLGIGAYRASTLRRMINRGELSDAADQFLRWNKAGGIVLRGLTRRCLARKRLFLSQ